MAVAGKDVPQIFGHIEGGRVEPRGRQQLFPLVAYGGGPRAGRGRSSDSAGLGFGEGEEPERGEARGDHTEQDRAEGLFGQDP